jgi:hypothetical protein
VIFIFHDSERREIVRSGAAMIAEPPTCIAALGALLSEARDPFSDKQSGFLDVVNPGDTEKDLEAKLADWEFALDADGRIIGERIQGNPVSEPLMY